MRKKRIGWRRVSNWRIRMRRQRGREKGEKEKKTLFSFSFFFCSYGFACCLSFSSFFSFLFFIQCLSLFFYFFFLHSFFKFSYRLSLFSLPSPLLLLSCFSSSPLPYSSSTFLSTPPSELLFILRFPQFCTLSYLTQFKSPKILLHISFFNSQW